MKSNQFGKKGCTPNRIGDLNEKKYVIIGTTSGTGYEVTKILLSKVGKVVMLNRNQKKSTNTIASLKQELGNNIDVSSIVMDLAEQNSVKKVAEEVVKTIPNIDALICNAAIAQVPKQRLTVDGWESQMGTNYYGNFTLQALLFPLIEKSKRQIVTVGSLGYDMGIQIIRFDDLN